MQYKDKFEFFRLAMVTGIIEKTDVIRWADDELLASTKPDTEVIELSLSGQLPYSQLIGLLNTFQGNPDHELPVKMLLAYTIPICRNNPERTKAIIQGIRLIKAEAGIEKQIVEGLNKLEMDLQKYQDGQFAQDILHSELMKFLLHYQEFQKEVGKVFNRR
jgi:hypothetical protein